MAYVGVQLVLVEHLLQVFKKTVERRSICLVLFMQNETKLTQLKGSGA